MASFAEVTRQVHLINDLILSDMICGNSEHPEENLEFSKRMLTTKYWFARISCANKKRFVLALLKDVRSIWTPSLLLKSIWNCRPKDAVMSVCEPRIWSSYDQVPMDHDRTAMPLSSLAEVMMSDRKWFQTLEPERQALVLSELLTVAGGPVVWEVLKHAQKIYEEHIEIQLEDLQECVVIQEQMPLKKSVSVETTPMKKEHGAKHKSSPEVDSAKPSAPAHGQAQKESIPTTPLQVRDSCRSVVLEQKILGLFGEPLETNLILWATTVKAMKDSMKLEELEMKYKNGTTKKIWKVNRPKPEAVETVDIIQLLPSAISKRILIYLPTIQLGDCARVNKYWAFLVDEIRAEQIARQKINFELEKMRDNMIKHGVSLDLLSKASTFDTSSENAAKSRERCSFLTTNKSCAVSLWTMMNKQAKKPRIRTKPIRNLADLNERLERRGAADENIWRWCKNILKISEKYGQKQIPVEKGGILSMASNTFTGPIVSKTVNIPLDYPLVVEPTNNVSSKPKVTVTHAEQTTYPDQEEKKRYTLWTKDFSRLYPVCKISSHMSPF